jgi:ATP-dependent exoDNAse (exonuclease V) beta subunit
MNSAPFDQAERDRFTNDWTVNFAVVANAGSGKTTAISERLAAIALSPTGAKMLRRTAVVTYTKKAAAEIEQRARSVLLRRMEAEARPDVEPLELLDQAFFGTIHSFCLHLARRHGSTLGVHLNPLLIEPDDDFHWQEFLEQDPMTFDSLGAAQADAFLRHASLDDIFELAKELDRATAERLAACRPSASPPPPAQGVLDEILCAQASRKGKAADALARNKEKARDWMRRFASESDRLPIAKPEGSASGIDDLYRRFFAPLKGWLAEAGGLLAAELSKRFRSWRLDRGIQNYADQIETALSVLEDVRMLERVRAEGWRVLLDEAQDTDPKQFAVLVEITRPPGAPLGLWPSGGGAEPRPGHFCMVGDPQQGIYSSRVDIRNFRDHVAAFEAGAFGEKLTFGVTFRAPRRVVTLLNETLPAAFGADRDFNFGLPQEAGAPEPFLQVSYEPLVAGPENTWGAAWLLPVASGPDDGKRDVNGKLAQEAAQIAQLLKAAGPSSVGATAWGDICVVAPRRDWLETVRDELEDAGLKTALQMRRNRNGDNPAYAWVSGLMAVVCDPDNAFEWVGVLREIFCVSDAMIASALHGGVFQWSEPAGHAEPVAGAIGVLEPFIDRADIEGESLEKFAAELSAACGLAAKARAADPEGGLEDELARLLARAAELGTQGAGPRAWLKDLLGSIDEFRAPGRPGRDAINLITSHSAKGLEWPVVIPVGLWRKIGHKPESGLRIVRERDGRSRVVFDSEGVGPETRLSLARELKRNTVRLLYVTLTRARTALVIPWRAESPDEGSFGEFWGLDPGALDPFPVPIPLAGSGERAPEVISAPREGDRPNQTGSPAPAFPRRILPHELAGAPDLSRASLHESSQDEPLPARQVQADPLEYGVWWHETLEFMPWGGETGVVAAHGEASLAKAAAMGFGDRAREEWDRLLASEPWGTLRDPRWTRLAEAGIFAPLGPGEWIDGVIDLVLHDPAANEVWIVDWKTNRRRAGEDDAGLLGRLTAEYESQLSAYGRSARGFFPGSGLRLLVYSTAAGLWAGVPQQA